MSLSEKYLSIINNSNGNFNEDDVWIGYKLLKGCQFSNRWDKVAKEFLCYSKEYDNENMYKFHNSTKVQYWYKIMNFEPYEETWELYSDAIINFNLNMGID